MPQMQVKNNILFPFMKMHGLGNDFVVIDARAQSLEMTESLARALGDRHRGVGFDQLAVILRTDSIADAYLKFYNSDGSTAGACGNATRCIARYLMDETGDELLSLETEHGILFAKDMGDQITSINMGHPDLNWQEIPLSQNIDTLELPIDGSPTATGMGNPHCTFFVGDVDAIDLETQGPAFEHHPCSTRNEQMYNSPKSLAPITSVCAYGSAAWASHSPLAPRPAPQRLQLLDAA